MAKPLIDWSDEESHVFINPFLPTTLKDLLFGSVRPHFDLKGHLWLATSGTEHFPKMIALSKKAMLASAREVNTHLQIQKRQPWLNILPLYHTGGLGIHARAHLSESPLFDFSEEKWDPFSYVQRLKELNISYSSLTPTHVYDIVMQQLKPPKSLIAIIVGGAALSESLHEKAYALGWPLLRSYGMTETCSQIATSPTPNPQTPLTILNHVQLRLTEEQFIELKSEALLTGFVNGQDPAKRFIDPKIDGWYTTQDKGHFIGDSLNIDGRGASFIKIGGENINFSNLEMAWENCKVKFHIHGDTVLIDLPDDRLGKIVCLAAVHSNKTQDLKLVIEEFHKQVVPIAKIRNIYYVEAIPRTSLFKLKKDELRKHIQEITHGS